MNVLGGWEHKHSVHSMGSVSVGSEAMTVQEGEQVSWKGQESMVRKWNTETQDVGRGKSVMMTKSESVAVVT